MYIDRFINGYHVVVSEWLSNDRKNPELSGSYHFNLQYIKPGKNIADICWEKTVYIKSDPKKINECLHTMIDYVSGLNFPADYKLLINL